MNTHDIELPPLPSPFGIVDPMGSGEKIYTLKDMGDYARDYARAPIEADRKRRGEPVGWLTTGKGGTVHFSLTNKRPELTHINGFDPVLSQFALYATQQPAEPSRGEPVGYFYPWELERSLKAYPSGFPGAVAVFAAPQPTEPVKHGEVK